MRQAAHSTKLFAAVALLAMAALPALPVLSAPPPAAPSAARQGWHGETMPAGLERGKKQGEYIWKKDESVMVYVPPGPFLMGNDKGEVAEKPAHTVELDGFYIDKYEVSWRKWKASGLKYLAVRDDRLQVVQAPDWGIHDGQPVVNVDWPEAKSYAAWAGKRLPTEAEWEKAARGTDGREYPWGNEPITNERAIWNGHPMSEISSAPVNCCQAGASPYGALNMAGNVWEWCEDSYSPDYYASSPRKNPINHHAGVLKIVRGGAMQLSSRYLHTYSRYWLSDVDRISDVGFRMALSGVDAAHP